MSVRDLLEQLQHLVSETADDDVRALERRLKADPSDADARMRLANARARAGSGDGKEIARMGKEALKLLKSTKFGGDRTVGFYGGASVFVSLHEFEPTNVQLVVGTDVRFASNAAVLWIDDEGETRWHFKRESRPQTNGTGLHWRSGKEMLDAVIDGLAATTPAGPTAEARTVIPCRRLHEVDADIRAAERRASQPGASLRDKLIAWHKKARAGQFPKTSTDWDALKKAVHWDNRASLKLEQWNIDLATKINAAPHLGRAVVTLLPTSFDLAGDAFTPHTANWKDEAYKVENTLERETGMTWRFTSRGHVRGSGSDLPIIRFDADHTPQNGAALIEKLVPLVGNPLSIS